jgi:hypothetical protein
MSLTVFGALSTEFKKNRHEYIRTYVVILFKMVSEEHSDNYVINVSNETFDKSQIVARKSPDSSLFKLYRCGKLKAKRIRNLHLFDEFKL